MTRKLLTEFLGTLLFLFAINLAVTSGTPMAPLAIGAALMCVVYMGGHVSGGHYNPAVSLAVVLRGKMPSSELVPYWLAQILGGFAGSLLAHLASGKSMTSAPGDGVTATAALIVEATFTFMLALVVLNVATTKSTSGNSFYGLAIGFTVVVAAFAGGGISGGAFNPAVATGSALNHAGFGGGTLSNLWIYWVGPLLGGAIAAFAFKAQNPGE